MEKKQEKTKIKKTTPKYDSGRETRVLLEDIRDQVKLVAEQHGDIKGEIRSFKDSTNQRFDRLEMAVMQNTREIKGLKEGQQEIKQKLDVVSNNHEKRIIRLEEKMEV
jgi:hypothetical protein